MTPAALHTLLRGRLPGAPYVTAPGLPRAARAREAAVQVVPRDPPVLCARRTFRAGAPGVVAGFFVVVLTSEYPEAIRDFLVGAYRYALRVEAYVGLRPAFGLPGGSGAVPDGALVCAGSAHERRRGLAGSRRAVRGGVTAARAPSAAEGSPPTERRPTGGCRGHQTCREEVARAPRMHPRGMLSTSRQPFRHTKSASFAGRNREWAIQDSNLGPLPYQENLLSPPVPPTRT